ncbi:F-box domain containing protein [Trema orientale]|uniref:F-box domain containing protein n=1 Tax=Trema orientale TaxID=63057 RepID=A0A2P5ATY9_TREOI|nr:F-box domain containing protein [Trema orientale]
MVALRRRTKKRRVSDEDASAAVAFRFMSTITDHLLVEILVRLPDSRSLIQCSIVCRRWFALIFGASHSQYLSRRFNHHHLQKQRLPYTLLIRGGYGLDSIRRAMMNEPPCYEFRTEKSNALHGRHRPVSPWRATGCSDYLDFLDSPKAITASFDDLLLIQRPERQFYVCNPLTRQSVALPLAPVGFDFCCSGLVCESSNNTSSSSSKQLGFDVKYRVVLLIRLEFVYRTAVFSSETESSSGEWEQSSFRFPKFLEVALYWNPVPFASRNGTIYWPIGYRFFEARGFAAFESVKGRWRFISAPDKKLGYVEEKQLLRKATPRFGVVRGRLRMAQSVLNKRLELFCLKVWELREEEDGGDTWILVHDVRVKMLDTVKMELMALLPKSDDDDDDDDGGDEFLFLRHPPFDWNFYKYKIGRDSFQKVCDATFPTRAWPYCSTFVFPLVHPPLPTKIPTLPCN